MDYKNKKKDGIKHKKGYLACDADVNGKWH